MYMKKKIWSMVKKSELLKPRIAMLISNLNGGGAERVFVTLANGFFHNGFSVDFLIIQKGGTYLNYLDNGINIIPLRARRSIFSIIQLILYLRLEKPISLFSTLSTVNILSVFACKLAKVNTKSVIRESSTPSIADGFLNWISRRIFGYLRRWSYNNADCIVVPSTGVAKDLIDNFGVRQDKISIICNPVEFQNWKRLASESDNYLDLLPKGHSILLGIGRLDQQKDFATLIKAFVHVNNSSKSILVLLGEGEERIRLEKLISDLGLKEKVFMPGFVKNPFPYIKRASVFVLSSKVEGLPNVILQALALGRPVVATDCLSGPRDILEDGLWGRLVPVGDCYAMANGILDGLADHIPIPDQTQMEAKYGIDLIVNKYLNILYH